MADLYEMIADVSVERIDEMLSNNIELQDMMLRNAEFIRLKNLEYFKLKSQLKKEERELETLQAEKVRNLNIDENKNEQTRKAAITLDPSCKAQQAFVDKLSIQLEEFEQEIWTLRHVESNLRMIAELRIIELKKTV